MSTENWLAWELSNISRNIKYTMTRPADMKTFFKKNSHI